MGAVLRTEFYVIPSERLHELRDAAKPRVLGSGRRLDRVLASFPRAPRAYRGSSHYVAFLSAYLSEVRDVRIPEPDLWQGLNDEYRGAVDPFVRDERTMELLRPGRIDEDDLLAEFQGGPPYTPEALPALREVIEVLRENVASLAPGEILLARSV